MKTHGTMRPMTSQKLSGEFTRQLADSLMNPRQREEFAKELECNFAISIPGSCTFPRQRLVQQQHVGMVIRTIPAEIPDFATLALRKFSGKIVMTNRGLVLVVGATGSGKSTSLAAMIDHRNVRRRVISSPWKDPVEFVHRSQQSFVHPSEIGIDTHSCIQH